MNNPKRPRHVQVQSWHDLSPHLRRIVFCSPELADYPFQCMGAHIKILLPPAGDDKPVLPKYTAQGPQWAEGQQRPIARTYTISGFDATACTISIDFVLHGDNGPASAFAEHVACGQTIGISAPAGPVPMLKTAAHYLFAGDITALPALYAMVNDMDADALGDILLWLPEEADLPKNWQLPKKLHLHTFYGDQQQQKLIEQFKQCTAPTDTSQVWLAGEAGMVAPLRQHTRQLWQVPLANCYAVPYWRMGESEEIYHPKRHDFMDNA